MSRAQRAKPCPICGEPSKPAVRPFCSSRCADIDLNRWLSGVYAVPVSDDDEEGETGQADPFGNGTKPEPRG